jgi:hypothetical protein
VQAAAIATVSVLGCREKLEFDMSPSEARAGAARKFCQDELEPHTRRGAYISKFLNKEKNTIYSD